MKVLVIGDVMLDRYWHGDVERVSPEAPVPVLHVRREEVRAGGAANVALNCAAMGAEVDLLGIVGDDNAGDILRHLCSEITHGFVTSTAPTIVKLRMIGRNHQLLRCDFEDGYDELTRDGLMGLYNVSLQEADRVVFSDYGKGSIFAVKRMIEMAKGKPTFVDPKGRNLNKYAGCSLIKPNRDEFSDMMGPWKDDNELKFLAQGRRKEQQIGRIMLTRASDGMTLFSDDGVQHFPAVAREVFDVTGAGDTAIAAMAVFDDVEIANRAAGIACGRFGTAVVSKKDLGL